MGDITDSIEQSFRKASPRSAEEFERGREFMPGVAKGAYFYRPYPLVIERGAGCHLHDIEGRRYVDFHNHHPVQILGHRHPAIVEAVNQQMERGIAFGAPIGTETDLAEEICRRVESIERVRFAPPGRRRLCTRSAWPAASVVDRKSPNSKVAITGVTTRSRSASPHHSTEPALTPRPTPAQQLVAYHQVRSTK